jgi:manganese-dependent inorganic pyrophosphatase
MPLPEFLETVRTQISDLDIDKVIQVTPDVSIKVAWMLMNKNNVKTLPVVDDNERLIGLATLSDITNKYMDTFENTIISASNTPLRNIIETLNAKMVVGRYDEFITSGNVVVAAMEHEQLKPFVSKGDLVIVGNRFSSQLAALEAGANCLIITNNCEPEPQVVSLAEQTKSIIIVTPQDTFTTARLINQSIPVRHVMSTENLIAFNTDDFVDEIKDIMLQTRYRSYPVVDDSYRIKGFISRYHLISKNKKKVILMDHNEKAQSVNGIEDADILEIIDHHRVADIQTGHPITFRNEPVGSTSTIVANIYMDSGIRPSKSIAGILCAAILSDTINLKSPTCTYVDKLTVERLSEIAGINRNEFVNQMFIAGTSLVGRTAEEIFYQDYKDFSLGKYKIGIGQVITSDKEHIGEIRDSVLTYMNKLCKEKNYALVMLIMTDIIEEGSEIIFAGDKKELIAKAFKVDVSKDSVYLPGVVSRKKQVVPPLSAAIE